MISNYTCGTDLYRFACTEVCPLRQIDYSLIPEGFQGFDWLAIRVRDLHTLDGHVAPCQIKAPIRIQRILVGHQNIVDKFVPAKEDRVSNCSRCECQYTCKNSVSLLFILDNIVVSCRDYNMMCQNCRVKALSSCYHIDKRLVYLLTPKDSLQHWQLCVLQWVSRC